MSRIRFAACVPLFAMVVACTTPTPRPTPPQPAAPVPVSTPAEIAPPAMPAAAPPVAAPVAPVPAAVPAPPPRPVAAPDPAPVVATPAPPPKPAPAAKPAVAAKPSPPPIPAKPTPAPPPKTKPKPAPAPAPVAAAKPVVEPAAPVDAAGAGRLSGRLELVGGGGQQVAPGEVADGLVYFLPKGGSPRPKPGKFSVDTRSKGFSPSLLVVPIGSTISFPNKDTILHSVFSRTPGASFDLGLYGPGEVRQTVMSKAGLVIVSCNVHHSMRANVVVLETPYYVRPDRNGRFTLSGLPAGAGTLVFWHPRSTAQTLAISAPSTATISRTLVASKPRIDAPMLMEH